MKHYFIICSIILSMINTTNSDAQNDNSGNKRIVHVQDVRIVNYKKPPSPDPTYLENKSEVEAAVQQLTKAMIDADSAQLYALTYPNLKYAHSTGKVQDQQEFVEGITSGRSDFVTIDLTDQTIDIVGNTACVRHILNAKTNDSNVPGHVTLAILLVWVKEHGQWRLLARQAVKPQS